MNAARIRCAMSCAIALAAALAPPSGAVAQGLSATGKLSAQTGMGIPNGHDSANKWNFLLGTVGAQGTLTAEYDAHTAYADASLTYDYIVDEDNLEFRLREGWYDYNGGWWAVRAGRQITAWGAADGVQVADVLCPQDQGSLWASDYSGSRLGIDALRLTLFSGTVTADAYWIPFFTPDKLPLKKGSPLRAVLVPAAVSQGGVTIPINDVDEDSFEKPETSLANGEYAFRAKTFLPFGDFSVYAFYGWDDLPVMCYTLGRGINISGEYKRMAMLGFDSSLPAGPLVLRLEGAFFPRRAMGTSAQAQLVPQAAGGAADRYVQRNQLVALAGLDWMPAGWTLTAQYRMDLVAGDINLLDRERYEHLATVSVSRSFFGDTLELSLSGMVELNHGSGALSATASYSATDELSVSLGANLFFRGPDKDDRGRYAAYEDMDCVVLTAEYRF